MPGALAVMTPRDCEQHGCCDQAYTDVFTACPGESSPPALPPYQQVWHKNRKLADYL